MERIPWSDGDAIRELLIGQRVTKVSEDTLTLDDGTCLTFVGNKGCGDCTAGWYAITALNDSPVNAITAVEFEETGYVNDQDLEKFRIFVLAFEERTLLLEVEGWDNGWYGVGYWIEVTRER